MCCGKLPKSALHNSAFFKECSSPQKGHSLKFELAFVKTLYKLGKLIEVRKRSEKDKNAKTPAKQKPRKKVFVCLFVFYQYRLKNDFKHLWKLASELLMHVFRLSLPSIFMNTLSGLWSFRSDFYPHQVVSLCRISTREKKKIRWKGKSLKLWLTAQIQPLPVSILYHTLGRN